MSVFDEVVGVDNKPQPRYPGKFYQDDAMQVLDILLNGGTWNGYTIKHFDFIWASPPCQKFTRMKTMKSAKKHVDLLTPTRKKLWTAPKGWLPDYCLENVVGAPLRDPVWLTGTMFGLGAKVGDVWFQLERKRGFEASFEIIPPQDKMRTDLPKVGVYGGHARNRSKEWGGRGTRDFVGHSQRDIAGRALDVEGMTLQEMSEAIPPAFSEHIAREWLRSVGVAA